jgi:hypothetical protein
VEVPPDLIVIGGVILQNATQLRFVEHDEVFEAFPSNGDPMVPFDRHRAALSKSCLLTTPRAHCADPSWEKLRIICEALQTCCGTAE